MSAGHNVLPLPGGPVYDKGATGDDEISAICKVQLTREQRDHLQTSFSSSIK